MIATIDIRVNAAHPNIPLSPLYAFEGSPSNVRILNVPQRVGKWQIDAVSVTIALPDNSSTTVPAVAVCGYWVATLPSCDETGYCAAGLQVTASGVDENGNAVSGYCLGVGDVTILSRDATAVSNGTRYYLHYVAEQPEHPNPGDMCYIDGTLKWYDGTAWQVFAAGGGGVDVVPPSTDPADEGKAADAKATGDALAGKRDKDDLAVYRKTYSAWVASDTDSGRIGQPWYDPANQCWQCPYTWEGSTRNYKLMYSDSGGGHDFSDPDVLVLEDAYITGAMIAVPVTFTRTFLGLEPVTGDALAKTSQLPTTPAAIGAATAAQGAKADTAVQPAALRYDLVQTITLGQLQDRAVQKVVLNAATTTLVLPALTDLSGKVSDFGIDVINAYAPEVDGTPTPTAASFQLDGTLGTDYNLIVPKGDTWSDMTALAAGEMAVYYFTRSAFQIGDVPTWEVVKKVVELVPVPTAP